MRMNCSRCILAFKGRSILILVLSLVSISVSAFFNNITDCCTTELSGYPFQYFYVNYGCSTGNLPVVLPILFVDLIIHIVSWSALHLIVIRIPKSLFK